MRVRLIKKYKVFQVKLLAFLLPVIFIVAFNQATIAQSNEQYNLISDKVKKIASEVTVFLRAKSSDRSEFFDSGSGVIITSKNDYDASEYYVLTVAHNLDSNNDNKFDDEDRVDSNYQVKTKDNKYHDVTSSFLLTTPDLGDLDLAVITFSSKRSYKTANFLDTHGEFFLNSVQHEQTIYVAGFPETKKEELSIDSGDFLEKQDKPDIQDRCQNRPEQGCIAAPMPFTGGYNLNYKPNNNGILPGMSGGPIFTSQGNLIGIHGREDWNGNKRGIGIDVFWNAAPESLKAILKTR